MQQAQVLKSYGHSQCLNVCKGAERLLSEGKRSNIVDIQKYGETFVEGARRLEDDPFALSRE